MDVCSEVTADTALRKLILRFFNNFVSAEALNEITFCRS
jgi:hypothetical protein